MVVIYVTAKINPEHSSAFLTAGQQFADSARQMEGCTEFRLYQDISDANTVAIYETWATKADFDNYSGSDLIAQFRGILGPMLLEPPQSVYYEAAVIDQ